MLKFKNLDGSFGYVNEYKIDAVLPVCSDSQKGQEGYKSVILFNKPITTDLNRQYLNFYSTSTVEELAEQL